MTNIFKGSEIVQIAIRIEQSGYKFYSSIATRAKEKQVKNVFEYLAGEEKKHEAVFTNMLNLIGTDEQPVSIKEDYSLYMEAVANSHIFYGNIHKATDTSSPETMPDAIDKGIIFEKDSIIFFHEMQNYIPQSQNKTVLRLIDEEKQHLMKLTDLKFSMSK